MLLPTDMAETYMNMLVLLRTSVDYHPPGVARKVATPRVEEGGRPS